MSEVEVFISPSARVQLCHEIHISDLNQFSAKDFWRSQCVHFINGVALLVSILELVIPHDLIALRVELFGRVELICDLGNEADLVGDLDGGGINRSSIRVHFSNVANSQCEWMDIGLEQLLELGMELDRVLRFGDWVNAVSDWLLEKVPGVVLHEARHCEDVERLITIDEELECCRWCQTF